MKINDINWEEVQLFYNNDKTWSDVCGYFNISQNLIISAKKLGLFISRSKSESISISLRKTPRKHSEETKKKISDIRKKYLQDNPDKVPYKLNHSSKESYPEKYFTEVFENEGIEVVKSFNIGIYELDFCILDKKIDIEIDDSQHYYDEKIVESDKRRNKFLEDNGWDIIRINWPDYQKLDFELKKEYISNLKSYINDLIDTKPFFEVPTKEIKIKEKKQRVENKNKKIKKEYLCKYCESKCTRSKDRCETCYHIQSRKVERPTLEQLKIDIKDLGYSGTGRKYGISDNSIRKWIKNYKD
jgi:very-short-patch-repair endonuclease